jgi:two-component system chemotaxis sensor kinase CheA
MFGFDRVSRFAHELENIFDLVRKGDIEATKELIDLTLSSRDVLRSMLEAGELESPEVEENAKVIIASLKEFIASTGLLDETALELKPETESPGCEVGEKCVTYRIRFRPAHNIFTRGIDPCLLFREIRSLGETKIVAQIDDIGDLNSMDPDLCYTYWDIILTTISDIKAIKDVFIFVEDDSEITIDIIDDEGLLGDEVSYKRLGEILVERGDLKPGDVEEVLREQKRLGDMFVEKGVVDRGKVDSALAEQEHVRDRRKTQQSIETASSIRVASEKLDKLVDLVGELVTIQARLTQTATIKDDPELMIIAEIVERLTAELRDSTMGVRMVPIGIMFSKFRRLARDLSGKLGKNVDLVTHGAETELDKTLIEKLNDPLIHLIRNTIDHGIEMPEVRESTGKKANGTVHLSAVHSGANVVIQISDDGAGVDHEAVRNRAIEKGLILPDAEVSEKEILELLFSPGFSTTKNITSVSGRGVGMDVVKGAIEALRGTIDINSTEGTGTTIMLTLPLTLAIIEGLLVKIAGEYFVLPLSSVEECIELTRDDVQRAHGRRVIRVREQLIPYIRLRERFNINGNPPDIEQVVITMTDEQRVGFTVDQVIGEHQTVIKSLGRFYKNADGVSGATILGDGTLALILDIPQLVRSVERKVLA